VSELFDEHGRPLEEDYDLEALARAAGLSTRALVRFVVLGLIDPLPERGPGAASQAWERARFPAQALARIARIQRLRRHLQVNLAGVGVVLELLERVEALERELERRHVPTRPSRRG
jgi:hypothetical protein